MTFLLHHLAQVFCLFGAVLSVVYGFVLMAVSVFTGGQANMFWEGWITLSVGTFFFHLYEHGQQPKTALPSKGGGR